MAESNGPTIDVSTGDHSPVNVASRDFVIAENYVQQIAQFSDLMLDDVSPPDFESPPIAQQLTKDIRDYNLLAFGGNRGLEKSTIAQHTAWLLQQTLEQEMQVNNGQTQVAVKEWIRSSDPQSLELAFKEDTTTIYLLSKIAPHHINYGLMELQRAASAKNHYVIITTDTNPDRWNLSEEAKKWYWRDLSPEDVYSPAYLVALLARKLGEVRIDLPKGVLKEGLGPDKPLVEDLTLHTVASQLKTPDKIAAFVQLLRNQKAPLQKEIVLDLIKIVQGDEQSIGQWYSQLTAREQLLTLGLSLFDGLFDDQLFAALEYLVNGVWRERDPLLVAFDYHDLDNLRTYFDLVPTSTFST